MTPHSLFLVRIQQGKGAYVNGKRLKASDTTDLNKAVIVRVPFSSPSPPFPPFPFPSDPLLPSRAAQIQEWGYERSQAGITKLLGVTEQLLRDNVQSVRQLGSGALDLCYVAAGRVDAVYTGVAGEGTSVGEAWSRGREGARQGKRRAR